MRCTSVIKLLVNTTIVVQGLTFVVPLNAADADNSAKNKHYTETSEATADQQESEAGKVETIRSIRRALTDDKSLSTYAHNIKIISDKNGVVLKGPVSSVAEKKKVETIAKASTDKVVKSELEVTTTK